jgi:GNAT superfamily N-acetyltransferase
VQDVLAAVADRWRRLEPLLPVPKAWAADQSVLAVEGAVGIAVYREPEPGAPLPMWFAAHGFSLRPLVTGVDVTAALDRLLTEWAELMGPRAREVGDDSAAYVFVPSRDVETFPALTRHGLAPYAVVAGRRPGYPNLPPGRAEVRQATLDDLDTVTALALTQAGHEVPFGTSWVRSTAAEQVRAEVERTLSTPEHWVWLGYVDGTPLGLITATPPAQNEWLTAYTDARPVAYLSVAWVDAKVRGAGVGAALAAAAHRAFDDAGIGLTLLHYSLVNPRSGPFWHRLGYRPLWTGWQARPARFLR